MILASLALLITAIAPRLLMRIARRRAVRLRLAELQPFAGRPLFRIN